MEVEEIKKYIGKKVLLVLKNNFKFTAIMPEFEGHSFEITDKFNAKVRIECDMISMIMEKQNGD